jgi:hypothetical protein
MCVIGFIFRLHFTALLSYGICVRTRTAVLDLVRIMNAFCDESKFRSFALRKLLPYSFIHGRFTSELKKWFTGK